jgi:hypothetical protein
MGMNARTGAAAASVAEKASLSLDKGETFCVLAEILPILRAPQDNAPSLSPEFNIPMSERNFMVRRDDPGLRLVPDDGCKYYKISRHKECFWAVPA